MGIWGARRKLLRVRPLVPKRKLSTNDRGCLVLRVHRDLGSELSPG